MPTNPDYGQADGKRVQFSDHGQKVVVTNWEDLNLEGYLNFTNTNVGAGLAGGTGGAQTTDLGAWYIYRAATGAYYAVNKLTGASVYTHATDLLPVWNNVIAALPGTNGTANTDRAGGNIEFGPHVFLTSGPLVINNKRSITCFGQGWLNETIIQQHANFAAGHYVFEIGSASDAVVLQGFEFYNMQIRGDRAAYSVGGGMSVYCSLGVFHDLGIQNVTDTAFYFNGPSATVTAYTNAVDRLHISGFGRSGAHTAHGIFIDQYVSDSDVLNSDVHQDNEAENNTTGSHGFYIRAGTSRLFNNHAYFCYDYGYYFDYAGNTTILDCIAESNGAEGLFINGPDGVKILGGGYYSNGQRGAATANNIYIANSSRFSIAMLHMRKERNTTVNVTRNISLDTCTDGRITDCTFQDATYDHILIQNTSTRIDVSQCEFLTLQTYSGGGAVNGLTPGDAIHIYNAGTNIKIHDNICAGTMGITEDATVSTTGTNEYYNNKLGGAITMNDGTTFAGRKWGNRDLSNVLLPDRMKGNGGTIGSANDLTLGHGTFFKISNAVQINGIATAGWDQGSVIILQFLGQPLIKNNGTPSAGFAKLKLSGGADVTPATTNDLYTFVYDGTDWLQSAPVSLVV